MTPCPVFVDQLRLFDPLLRVRWGVRTNLWIIERKMPEQHKQLLSERPSPWKSPRGLDLYDGWKEGYVHVLSVHPTMLDTRVFDVLREHDSWHVGGMEKLSQAFDAIQACEEAQADRAIATWNESASREMHDLLQWGLGNRIGMQPASTGVKQADRIEKHDGFTVIIKRADHGAP